MRISQSVRAFILSAITASLLVTPGYAQGSGAGVSGVVATCAPIIDQELKGDHTRWGQCVAAVADYVKAVGAPSASSDPQLADLVIELSKLFQKNPVCRFDKTELPLAIKTAAQASLDRKQRARIVEVALTISDCVNLQTAEINSASPF